MEEYWSRLEKNILPQCPSFCRIFIEEMKVAMMKDSTLYVYCLDLMSFLEFLTLYHSKFIHLAIPSFTIKDMEEIDEYKC